MHQIPGPARILSASTWRPDVVRELNHVLTYAQIGKAAGIAPSRAWQLATDPRSEPTFSVGSRLLELHARVFGPRGR